MTTTSEDIQKARASIGAIHFHACRCPEGMERVFLQTIAEECEHVIPELAGLRPEVVTETGTNPQN